MTNITRQGLRTLSAQAESCAVLTGHRFRSNSVPSSPGRDGPGCCAAAAPSEVFLPLLPSGSTPGDLVRVLGENFYALDRFFLGLTQGRRPRAGAAFELVIRRLFVALNYPFTSQAVINGQPDFILPSVEHFRKNAMDAIIFTVKRTLRERWRQIVTE
ncbi:MAG TPA: type II restriction endonuclease [Candidatus Limnocylindrales bacterium]|nr:type II restriction endonuclease [Candidatus Limnocylindrales bacterium]